MKKPIAWPPSVLSAVPDPCTEVTLRILTLPILLVSPGPERSTCSTGTLRGSNQTLNISNEVMILAPVASAISSAEPTSSRWPSATTMASTLGKSATFTGLSGLVTNGLVRITVPSGEVNRKIDQEKNSSVTGFEAAEAATDHNASRQTTIAPARRADDLCFTASSPVAASLCCASNYRAALDDASNARLMATACCHPRPSLP